jgi:hypothetical protein
VEAHLESCDSCRADLHLLRDALDQVRRESAPQKTDAVWSIVQSRIRQWEEGEPEAGARAQDVRKQVAHQIGLLLGSHAASRVLAPVSPNNQNLFSVVEPLLGEFLGPAAAAALVNRVVDSTIVKL